MKVVLDTSVLIAAFYKPIHYPSLSKDVYDYLCERESVHVSTYILEEFHRKCLKKLKMTVAQVAHLESLIKMKVHIDASAVPKNISVRDAKDVPILALALSLQANLLLTWDKDLLVLKKVRGVVIESPKQFWHNLR